MKSGSEEEKKSGDVLCLLPLFPTSSVPLFTVSKPGDKGKTENEKDST